MVRLGDNSTLVNIKEVLVVPVVFKDSAGKECRAEIKLIVWRMPGLDMIIGLPHILKHFSSLLIDMLRGDDKDTIMYSKIEEAQEIDLINPWSVEPEGIASEEENTKLPCSFTGPLYYLSITHEEAVQCRHKLY